MNIAIEARSLSAIGGGVRHYTHQLINNLISLKSGNDYIILTDQAIANPFKGAANYVIPLYSKLLLPVWLNINIPLKLNSLRPDLVHYTKAAIPHRHNYPTVVTIYDIIPILFPSSQKASQRIYWFLNLKYAAHHSNHIITISQSSKNDLIKKFGVAATKITVTPLAINTSHFKPSTTSKASELKKRLQISSPFILYLGTIEPRKNVSSLISAFSKIASQIPHQLIIAGSPDKGARLVKKLVAQLKLTSKIKFIDFVNQQDLPTLYSAADLFVWPSVYEGWGFPPQEAMACGTPVITTDGGALPEVVGSAGRIIKFTTPNLYERTHDTAFINALSQQMALILTDPSLSKQMIKKGVTQAQKNSWRQVALKTLAVYQQLIK